MNEEQILLSYKENKHDKEPRKLLLHRITYQDEKGRVYVFISNNMVLSAQDIANIYMQRWQMELFKKMKQNFQLHCFYGESENEIRIQI